MNERIGRLAEQAGLIGPSSRIGNSHDAAEKFAQLIVQACADLALSHSIYSRGVPWNQVILQHWSMPIANTDVAPYLRTPQRP
jgi:hypothetical protein